MTLTLFGAGCSTTKYVAVKPSAALTGDCEYPKMKGETWRDLAQAYTDRGQALKECTDRMRAIRK